MRIAPVGVHRIWIDSAGLGSRRRGSCADPAPQAARPAAARTPVKVSPLAAKLHAAQLPAERDGVIAVAFFVIFSVQVAHTTSKPVARMSAPPPNPRRTRSTKQTSAPSSQDK